METKVESLRSNDRGWNGGALEYSPLRKVRMKNIFYRLEIEHVSNLLPKYQKKNVYLQFDLNSNVEYRYRHIRKRYP